MLIFYTFSIYPAAAAANKPAQDSAAVTAFIYTLAGVVLFIGLWNLTIAVLGLFPKCRASAVGTLTKANTKINHRTRHGHLIPRLTHYAYTYSVNSKLYRYAREIYRSKRRLLPKISLVYVKGFPRHAYPNKFTGAVEWVTGLGMLFLGALFLYILSSAS